MTNNCSLPNIDIHRSLGVGAALGILCVLISAGLVHSAVLGAAVVLAFIVSSAIQVAGQWSKAVVLRLAKSYALFLGGRSQR